MDPFTIASLTTAGFKILGANSQKNTAKINASLQTTANNLNAEVNKTQVLKNYSSAMEEQKNRMGTQRALAGGADKANSAYGAMLTEHERSFLSTQNDMNEDLAAIQRNASYNNSYTSIQKNQAVRESNMSMITGMTDAFMNYQVGNKVTASKGGTK